MQIQSHFVGSRCRPLTLKVTPRMSMNFAASVDDNNPWYFDDVSHAIIAPPMMASALTWPISIHIEDFWQAEGFTAEIMNRKVHYLSIVESHAPIMPGQTLRIEGELTAMLEHRAGTHMVIRYEGYDEKDTLVFVEYAGAMLRDVECVGGSVGAENIPPLPGRAPKGEPLWEKTISIDPLAAHHYDAGADVHFPIHTSPAFAQGQGLPGVILHGSATQCIVVREITNREAGADPRRIQSIRCNFTGMVTPGTDITLRVLGRCENQGLTHIHFSVFNQEGHRAIHKGCVTLRG